MEEGMTIEVIYQEKVYNLLPYRDVNNKIHFGGCYE